MDDPRRVSLMALRLNITSNSLLPLHDLTNHVMKLHILSHLKPSLNALCPPPRSLITMHPLRGSSSFLAIAN